MGKSSLAKLAKLVWKRFREDSDLTCSVLNGIDLKLTPKSSNDLLDKGEINVALQILISRRLPVYEASSFLRLQESFHFLNLQVVRKVCTIKICIKL